MKGPCRSLRPPPRIRLCLPNLLRPTVFKPQRTSHPEPPQQWHPLAVLAAPGAKSWTRCAACLGGPPRSSLGGFERAPLPSAICALASSCYSLRTCPPGLPCCSPPSSCCCWRVTAFSSNTLPPTPSSSGRFSSTYASCSWVRPCVYLFRHFFVLVGSGKSKDEIGAYYFQTRSSLATSYLPDLAGGKWEEWLKDWEIASTDDNERLDSRPAARPPTARIGGPDRSCRRSSTRS